MSAWVLLCLLADTRNWIQLRILSGVDAIAQQCSYSFSASSQSWALSAVRNVLHGPGLSFDFSSFRSNLEVKPQEKTVQQLVLQSIRCAALFVIFSCCSLFSFLLRSSYLGPLLEREDRCWMSRWSFLCPTNEGVSAYPSQQRGVSRRSCAFNCSTVILNKAKIR